MNDSIRKQHDLIRQSSPFHVAEARPNAAAPPDPEDARPWNGSVASVTTGMLYAWTNRREYREAIERLHADNVAFVAMTGRSLWSDVFDSQEEAMDALDLYLEAGR